MDRWQQAGALFDEAVELPPDSRVRFLAAACGGDEELRRQVEGLLEADTKGGEGIAAVIELEAQSLFGMETPADSRIGAYRIVREIGRGGMSTVYLAVRDDDQFHKQVAIKLIRRGMDTDDLLSRFRDERQILANLEHTYIARLLDGGAASDGRPFLVMEYIQGEPLDVWRRSHAPESRAICALFLKICGAVSFAHRNLVVHRDLKPGNILVDPTGDPKLLDFGIAKLLDPERGSGLAATLADLRPMTVEYASPEQFHGEPITTAADVYSLGAILYELLSGVRAHRFANFGALELERVICRAEPPLMSEAATERRAELHGDLDAIVAQALRKEPAQRYASVDQLEADLQRYLQGWPVQARQGNFSYRTRKFLRRNRTAIVVAGLISAALIGGATAAGVQARRAERERLRALASEARAQASRRDAEREAGEAERQRRAADDQRREAESARALAEKERALADQRFEQVHQLAARFVLDFNDAIAKLPGSTAARKMVVETGLKYLDGLLPEARGNRQLLEEIARGYDRFGDVQGNPFEANLGDFAGALDSYKKARAIRDQIVDASPKFLRDRMGGEIKIAEWLQYRGNLEEAERHYRSAFELGRSAAANNAEVRLNLGEANLRFGDLRAYTGAYKDAIEPYSRALEIFSASATSGVYSPKLETNYSACLLKLADALIRNERSPEAIPHLRAALAIDEPLLESDPNDLLRVRKVYQDYLILSHAYTTDSGKSLDSAASQAAAFERAAALADRMAAADPNDARTSTDVRMAQLFWGDYLRERDDAEGALAHYRRGLESAKKEYSVRPQAASSMETMVMALHRMARGSVTAHRPQEALDNAREAARYLAEAEKASPGAIRWVGWTEDLRRVEGLAWAQMKAWPQAIEAYLAEIEAIRKEMQAAPGDDSLVDSLWHAYGELADCYAGAGRRNDAAQAAQTTLDTLADVRAHRPFRADEERMHADISAKLAAWREK